MKILLLILLALGLIGGYAYASGQSWFPANAPKISAPALDLQGNPQEQLTVLSSRIGELGGHAQSFIGSGIQKDTSQPSLSQKALDYGQYLYCKQVVTTYEAQPKN